jgi:GTP-binding protein Era
MRFGTAALVGRSNVGKSTFLNAALGERLSIVSPLPQTTREALLGVLHREDAQIAFIDTPGLHRPRSELGRRMNASAVDAARGTDVVVMMTDVNASLDDDERAVLALLDKDTPTILVINKIDLLRDKSRLLPKIEAYLAAHPFREVIPVSLREGDGLERVLDAIAALLPEGDAGYEPDALTNRPLTFFVREFVREQVLLRAAREVPHAVAVTIDAIEDSPRALVIKATLHVEKEGQRGILIGKGGERIREIGTGARERIEELTGRKVYLELFVRVTPRWKHVPRQLSELGYEAPDRSTAGEVERLLPSRGRSGRIP